MTCWSEASVEPSAPAGWWTIEGFLHLLYGIVVREAYMRGLALVVSLQRCGRSLDGLCGFSHSDA